jgi:hypothetical protein
MDRYSPLTSAYAVEPYWLPNAPEGIIMAVRKKWMTMNRAIAILRKSGWRVDVDEANKRIILKNPLPDVNWLHVLRKMDVPKI